MPPTPTHSPILPSGAQWTLAHGSQRATICEVGATLRTYSVGGRAIIDGFGETEWATSGRGQVLAPWPNRLEDGTFTFGDRTAAAPIDDVSHGTANHGLVRWLPWRPNGIAQNRIALGVTIHPSPRYPFGIELLVDYHLGREGLVVTTTATNVGDVTAPFGLGFHPYLATGAVAVDELELEFSAANRLVLNDRLLPTGGRVAVASSDYDFSTARRIGELVLNDCYCDLVRDREGLSWVHLSDRWRGWQSWIWADASFPYLQVFSGDTVAIERRRRGLAVEPMTCAPNALRDGDGLVVLDPGQSWSGSWGIGGK